jgi:hypothetical protein
MKRSLTIILLFAMYSALQGQSLTVSLPTITANPGQVVYVPVKLSGASATGVPIIGANVQITFDTAVLRYDTLTSFYAQTPQSQWFFSGYNGLVSANWLEPALNPLAIPDNTTLFEIRFTYKGGNSPLTFVVTEFINGQFTVIPTTGVNGAVNAPMVFRQVTFRVDMSKETITPNGVHLAGSFNNWNPTQTPMTFAPGTSIYSATVSLQEGSANQYRFVNGNTTSGLETVPPSCGAINGSGQYDRQITVPDHDTTYEEVCFSKCGPCPVNVNVTFRVDMQNKTVSPDGVHAAGTFNSWNYSQTLMASSGGTIYEASVTMEEGTAVEFKYANGNNVVQAETVPAACALNGNRYFTVPGHDTVMTAYCYDSCTACGTVAQYALVTFRVDMRTKTVSPDGVHLAGTFQGWNPAATPMASTGDSIFTYTESLLSGTSVQYKFVNGNSAEGYETVPFACSSNGDRTFVVPVNDTILKTVCYAECDSCVTVGTDDLEQNHLRLDQNFPNPASEITHIGYRITREGYLKLALYSPMGRIISVLSDGECKPGTYTLPIKTNGLSSGIYYYQMTYTSQGKTYVQSKKMIVQ